MKKALSIVFFFLVLLQTLSCSGKVTHWQFRYSVEEIESIEIIEFDAEKNGRFTVLGEVEKELFGDITADIEAIEFTTYETELVPQTGKGIKINFASGEYDIITAKEPKHHEYYSYIPSEDGVIVGSNSFLQCKESKLNALIERYLSK